MKPNGKNLILELLMANQNQAISAKEAIAAAALFGRINDNFAFANISRCPLRSCLGYIQTFQPI